MKKTMMLLAVACSISLGVNAQSANYKHIKIDTQYLEPIEYSSQAQKDEVAIPRIEVIKKELERTDLSDESAQQYLELLWRFENAVVVEKKD